MKMIQLIGVALLTMLIGCASNPDKPASIGKPYSSGYAAKVAARIKANLIFVDKLEDIKQPTVVKLYTNTSGEILRWEIIKSSGNYEWDGAVIRAIHKTKKVPLDLDGRVPLKFELVFTPKT